MIALSEFGGVVGVLAMHWMLSGGWVECERRRTGPRYLHKVLGDILGKRISEIVWLRIEEIGLHSYNGLCNQFAILRG